MNSECSRMLEYKFYESIFDVLKSTLFHVTTDTTENQYKFSIIS